jgi:predicted ATPase
VAPRSSVGDVEYTRRDVICLHLEGAADYRDGATVPREFTVPGMSSVLETGTQSTRRHLDLLGDLRALEEEGLVESVTRRVEDGDAERNVYVLTERGRERVAELRRSLADETVEVTNGTTETVGVDELGRYFDDHPVVRGLARLVEEDVIEVDRSPGSTFVDRTAALETLETACEATLERGARAVVVGGAAGSGKTRLVEEAAATGAGEEFTLAAGRCRRGADEPYAPFVQAFDDLSAGPDLGTVLDRASANTATDPDDVDVGRTALFDDVADALRAASTDQPVALFVDNLQWADSATLSLLEHLVAEIDEWIYPVLFVLAYRPEAVGGGAPPVEFLAAVTDDDRTDAVELGPLDREACRRLVERVVGVDDVPERYLDRLVEETGGNPLFVRETVAMQVDDGALDPAAGEFPDDAAFETPDPVAAVVEERLAGVEGTAREVLEAAAVADERVAVDLLVEVAEADPPDVRDCADVLAASRVWTVEDDHVRFTSGLLRDAVRDRLADDAEATYHRRVAEALADRGDGDRTTHAEAAEHYRAAGDDAAAVDRFLEAADRAADVYAHAEAVEHCRSALALSEAGADGDRAAAACRRLAEIRVRTGEYDVASERVEEGREHGPGADERMRLAASAAKVAQKRGDPDAALAAVRAERPDDPEPGRAAAELAGVEAASEEARGEYDAAEAAAERQHDLASAVGADDLVAKALEKRGVVALRRGAFDEARGHLEAALSTYRDVGDRHGAAGARLSLGNALRHQDDYAAAETHYEAVHSTFREVGDDHQAAKALASLGTVAMKRADLEAAEEYYASARETFEAVGDRASVARIFGNLGLTARNRDDLEAAREYNERALAAFREVGDQHGAGITQHHLGDLNRDAGDLDRAEEYLREALATYREIGDQHGEGLVLSSLGDSARERGDLETARERYEAALDVQGDEGDRREVATTLEGLGEVALEREDFESAREHAERARSQLADHEAAGVEGDPLLLLGRVALAAGRFETARDHLEAARETFADADRPVDAGRARGYLAAVEVAAGHDDLAREHAEAALSAVRDHDPVASVLDWLQRAVEVAEERRQDDLVGEWCDRALAVLPDDADRRSWFERRAPGDG